MSFGVDVLGTLTEKLKHMFDETQGKYSIFMNDNKLYNELSINEKEFSHKIIDYVVNLSALNFLAIRVVLELKSAVDKGTSIKDATGGLASPSASQQTSFGISGFISAGGSVGIDNKHSQEQLVLPTFKPVDIEIEGRRPTTEEKAMEHGDTKTCSRCGVTMSSKAKFCKICGTLQ
jgi:hypothetical protein